MFLLFCKHFFLFLFLSQLLTVEIQICQNMHCQKIQQNTKCTCSKNIYEIVKISVHPKLEQKSRYCHSAVCLLSFRANLRSTKISMNELHKTTQLVAEEEYFFDHWDYFLFVFLLKFKVHRASFDQFGRVGSILDLARYSFADPWPSQYFDFPYPMSCTKLFPYISYDHWVYFLSCFGFEFKVHRASFRRYVQFYIQQGNLLLIPGPHNILIFLIRCLVPKFFLILNNSKYSSSHSTSRRILVNEKMISQNIPPLTPGHPL